MDLEPFRALVGSDSGLVVVSIARPDGSVHASVVNAGVLAHPHTAQQVVGFVVMGGARKLTMLRARPQVTVTIRAGWQWSTVEGRAQLIGPDDPADGFDAERIRILLRDIFTAAGGTHDDWDTYDRVMREERRTAVLVEPTTLYPKGRR